MGLYTNGKGIQRFFRENGLRFDPDTSRSIDFFVLQILNVIASEFKRKERKNILKRDLEKMYIKGELAIKTKEQQND